ncbi:MAG TPA: hypothetical protein VFH70_03410 [Acidimicrobiales bacterium]|nr:hypothetical protein [Acidimicrobiales bacterium]
MIIVDDRLSLEVLSGRLDLTGCATTWGFHYRLTRALLDPARRGALSGDIGEAVRSVVTDPPRSRLVVLDPRDVTGLAAEMSIRHGLNLLAAEMVAAAVHHRAPVYLSAANVGKSWPDVLEAEAVALTVI